MKAVNLDNIVLAKGALTDTIYAGVLENDKKSFKHKRDVTGYFAKAVVDMYEGYETEFTIDNKRYKVRVERVEE